MNPIPLNQALSQVLGEISKHVILPLRRDGEDVSHVAAHCLMECVTNTCFSRDWLVREEPDLSEGKLVDAQKQVLDRLHTLDHSKYLINYAFQKIKEGLVQRGIEMPEFQKLEYDATNPNVILVQNDVQNIVEASYREAVARRQ